MKDEELLKALRTVGNSIFSLADGNTDRCQSEIMQLLQIITAAESGPAEEVGAEAVAKITAEPASEGWYFYAQELNGIIGRARILLTEEIGKRTKVSGRKELQEQVSQALRLPEDEGYESPFAEEEDEAESVG